MAIQAVYIAMTMYKTITVVLKLTVYLFLKTLKVIWFHIFGNKENLYEFEVNLHNKDKNDNSKYIVAVSKRKKDERKNAISSNNIFGLYGLYTEFEKGKV